MIFNVYNSSFCSGVYPSTHAIVMFISCAFGFLVFVMVSNFMLSTMCFCTHLSSILHLQPTLFFVTGSQSGVRGPLRSLTSKGLRITVLRYVMCFSVLLIVRCVHPYILLTCVAQCHQVICLNIQNIGIKYSDSFRGQGQIFFVGYAQASACSLILMAFVCE